MYYKRLAYYALVIMVMIVAIKTVLAVVVPSPPDTITAEQPGTHAKSTTGYLVQAQAGNVTGINISDIRVTNFWQGYYGNVTGQIVLDDASNSTLFAWELARPQGEVFATNASGLVNWDNITCVNLSISGVNQSYQKINLTTLVVQFNMNTTSNHPLENLSKDAFNYTFNTSFAKTVSIAGNVIGDDDTDMENCAQAYTFVNDNWQQARFAELLLFDNDSALVFTALLEDNIDGYQSGGQDLHDFQMLVAEDGSPRHETQPTTYYFYVELE